MKSAKSRLAQPSKDGNNDCFFRRGKMKKAILAYWQFLAQLLIAVSLIALPAAAFPVPDRSADEKFSNTTTTDGKIFAEKMRKSLDGYNDYTFDSAVYMYNPEPQFVAGGNICFKKINFVRLTVQSKGVKNGAVVVRSCR